MADLKPPVLTTEIPAQIVNEGASFLLNLNDFVQSPDESGELRFFAELSDGRSMPEGLICTMDGLVSGIPAKGTEGGYEVSLMVENDSGIPLTTQFGFTIKARISLNENSQHFTELKSKLWEALGEGLPLPDMTELLNRPITHDDIYFLIQRLATFKIWDVYNLDPPGEPKLLQLAGASPHFNVYDRGCYLIAVPKELYSTERTLEDALLTAKVMAKEIHKRGWTVEFTGFGKMARAAWVELQVLGDKLGSPIEVIHYTPTTKDIFIYESEKNAVSVFGQKKLE